MDQSSSPITSQTNQPFRWWTQLSVGFLIIIELIWVVAWYQLMAMVSNPPQVWLTVLVLGSVLLASYTLTVSIESLRLISQLRFLLLGILLFASLFAANAILLSENPLTSQNEVIRLDPLFLINIGFVLWLWSRGIGLGNQLVRPAMAWRRFQGGLVNLMLYTLLASILDMPAGSIGIYVLYLICGLMGVILARIAYVSVSRSARKNPFNRSWILSIGSILTGSVMLAAVIAWTVTGQFRSILNALAVGFGYLFAIFVFVSSIPGLILVYLFSPLAPWLREQLAGQSPLATPQPNPINPYPFGDVPETGPLPLNAQMFCFWSLVFLIVAIVFLVARRSYRRRRQGVAEGPESILSQGDASRLVRKAVDDFLEGFGNRFRRSSPQPSLARIRRIYSDLLLLGSNLRHPRPAHSTPNQYLVELIDVIPGVDNDLATITQLYDEVRYGELNKDDNALEEIEKSWNKVAEAGRIVKKGLPRQKVFNETPEPDSKA